MSLLAKALWWIGPVLVLEGLALSAGIIRLQAPRRIDNVPFANPVGIVSLDDRSITLADGRILTPDAGVDSWLREEIERSKGMLGLEVDPDHPERVRISVRRPRFICGTCEGLIVIPLSTYNWPRYTAAYVGDGTTGSPDS